MIYDFVNHLQKKTTVTLLGVKWYALILLRQIKIVVEAILKKKGKERKITVFLALHYKYAPPELKRFWPLEVFEL